MYVSVCECVWEQEGRGGGWQAGSSGCSGLLEARSALHVCVCACMRAGVERARILSRQTDRETDKQRRVRTEGAGMKGASGEEGGAVERLSAPRGAWTHTQTHASAPPHPFAA
eukprot:3388995-Rhodomonas_salina.1